MHVTSSFLFLLLPASLLATSVFKFPQERQLIEPLVPQCPENFDEVKPWYEDPNDCNCYYVCDMYGGMVRMCCPADLWFDPKTMNCHYIFSFTKEKQAKCLGNLKGEITRIDVQHGFTRVLKGEMMRIDVQHGFTIVLLLLADNV